MDVTIRPMRIDDIPSGLRLCRLSHWNQLEEDWRAFLESPSGGGRLAERAGAALGTVAFLRYGPCFSWLSMMLVHPAARRTGIGGCLMNAALEALAGERCVRLDATPLGENLYQQFGFAAEFELARMKITVQEKRPAWVSANARPMEIANLASVFARDRQVFGADRSAVLASFFQRAPDLAWIVYPGQSPGGYCFGRPGHLYRQIGPVVAENATVAQELVAACLAGMTGETIAMDVPWVAPEWTAWLEASGFLVERRFLRMYRGERPGCGIAAHQFAMAGPEFG